MAVKSILTQASPSGDRGKAAPPWGIPINTWEGTCRIIYPKAQSSYKSSIQLTIQTKANEKMITNCQQWWQKEEYELEMVKWYHVLTDVDNWSLSDFLSYNMSVLTVEYF